METRSQSAWTLPTLTRMTSATLRVLWVCGAPAVGKSTAAWQLWQDLVAEDVPPAYVDIDQPGTLYPAPAGAGVRHQAKVAARAGGIANHRSSGAAGRAAPGHGGRAPAGAGPARPPATACHMGWPGAGLATGGNDQYQVQIIYRTCGGGDHFTHVHFGVHRGRGQHPSVLQSAYGSLGACA